MLESPNYQVTLGHVRYLNEREWWVYDLRAQEVRFLVDPDLVAFGVAPDHPVSVVCYHGYPVAARNHHTGQTWIRPGLNAPYQQHQSGCLGLLFLVGLVAALLLGAAGGVAGIIVGAIVAAICWQGVCSIVRDNDEVTRHNLQVTEDLQRRLSADPELIRREARGTEIR